ncbi:hypothetical protein CAP39_08435 [Sphingomonas sp. IBVSS1]|nr:hypothetical protein CAP39_08435 [Sphingomonas sp. IBVSS1]
MAQTAREDQPMRVTGLMMALALAGPAWAQEAPPPPPQATSPAEAPPPAPDAAPAAAKPATYQEKDVLTAAEGVFGKGAEGLADIVRKTFKDRGQPNAYIVGKEAGLAVVVGVRYGSGMLYHKVEGERKVHWTGPSVGFDIGGDGSKVFALVYNLNDSEDLYRRYPAAEGKAYVIGGFTANYLQRDNIVIVPIKLGVGWRLGLNAGYMKFSKKGKILPF